MDIVLLSSATIEIGFLCTKTLSHCWRKQTPSWQVPWELLVSITSAALDAWLAPTVQPCVYPRWLASWKFGSLPSYPDSVAVLTILPALCPLWFDCLAWIFKLLSVLWEHEAVSRALTLHGDISSRDGGGLSTSTACKCPAEFVWTPAASPPCPSWLQRSLFHVWLCITSCRPRLLDLSDGLCDKKKGVSVTFFRRIQSAGQFLCVCVCVLEVTPQVLLTITNHKTKQKSPWKSTCHFHFCSQSLSITVHCAQL